MDNIKTFDSIDNQHDSWALDKIDPFSHCRKPRQRVFVPKDNLQLQCNKLHNRRDPLLQSSRMTAISNPLSTTINNVTHLDHESNIR